MSQEQEKALRTYHNLSFENEKGLLEQKYISYFTIFEEIRVRAESEDEKRAVETVDRLFKEPKSWVNISTIQQCLVGLMSEEEVEIDFNVRIIKAGVLLSGDLLSFYRSNFKGGTFTKKKELLEGLIRDIQWYSKIHDLERAYVSKTRIRTGALFLLSIMFFFAVDQFQWLADQLSITKGDKGDAILTAVTSGTLGTCFSMLIGLKNRLHLSTISDLRVLHRFDYITSRALIGFVSGLILFYFFDSQLIQAPLIPKFNHIDTTKDFLNHENLALLVVWCFISGFSEKLVPDLLFRAGQSLRNDTAVNDEAAS